MMFGVIGCFSLFTARKVFISFKEVAKKSDSQFHNSQGTGINRVVEKFPHSNKQGANRGALN